jgi:hypothetical protein
MFFSVVLLVPEGTWLAVSVLKTVRDIQFSVCVCERERERERESSAVLRKSDVVSVGDSPPWLGFPCQFCHSRHAKGTPFSCHY